MDDRLMEERPLHVQAQTSCSQAIEPQAAARSRTSHPASLYDIDLSPYSIPQNQPPTVPIRKDLDGDAMLETPSAQARTPVTPFRRPQRAHADSFDSVQSDDSFYDNNEHSRLGDQSENRWLASWRTFSSSRLMLLSLLLLVVIPLLHETTMLTRAGPSILGASAGVVKRSILQRKALVDGNLVVPRANTDPGVCNRWSQQSALVNGTIYLYGGRASTEASQTSNEWNNDFLTIDVTKTWDISSPAISGLPQPSGPPSVANGYLWNSYDSLFLYGGEFQDNPVTTPVPYSLWEYNIPSASWTEHQNPQTSNGNNSDGGNQPVMGSAEGAGVSIPELGRGYFFAGHEDTFTTAGWSNQVSRIYLKSLLEFTFPGFTNNGIQNLSGGKTAGSDGAWRNVTQGGIQDTATFTSRADSVLVYVPGYGVNGILINIGGGTNESFVSVNGFSKFSCLLVKLTLF